MNARLSYFSIVALAMGVALPVLGANTRTVSTAAPKATTAAPRTATTAPRVAAPAPKAKPATRPSAAVVPPVKTNPLLPAAIPIDGFYGDMSLVQKLPAVAPPGFDPIYTAADWQAFNKQFGTEAQEVTKLKSTAVAAFADKLLLAATGPELATPEMTPGLRRLLILRAATIAYRNKDGFPVADKAVAAYLTVMDTKSATQVGALWTIANTMARTSVTPKGDRIRYDAIAAKANMQLALLLLDADQIAAAEAIIKQVAYHEGWLKKDAATRAQIAHVRTEVRQQASLMDFLATQYQQAIQNDVPALTNLYLYGRYVKGSNTWVAQLPTRVPGSALAQLAATLDSAGPERPAAAFAAAESLRAIASKIPDALIRQRTLYAAMQLYDVFISSPLTERDRVNRTLARIAREGVISDGARKGHSINPFAVANPPATLPSLHVVAESR